MLRRSFVLCLGNPGLFKPEPPLEQQKPKPKDWKGWVKSKAKDFVDRSIPDPRKDPLYSQPVGYKEFKDFGDKLQGREKESTDDALVHGETLEDYIAKRNKAWRDSNQPYTPEGAKKLGYHTTADGGLFFSGQNKEQYDSLEVSKDVGLKKIAEDAKVDNERVKLRRQLQVDREADYRRFVAEQKRGQIQETAEAKKRVHNTADPKYNPFKNNKGYAPSDSAALAKWYATQKASGYSASGLSLDTHEGQERFYNEEKMATQFHTQPHLQRIEMPRGKYSISCSGYSPDSFFVNDREVIGSLIMTQTRYYHWNVQDFNDVNLKSLSLLLHIYPVPDIIFLGTGRNQYHVSDDIITAFRKRGTRLHCLKTNDALFQFSVQISEKQRVACACLPMIPTNPYGREAFGDFIENDAFSLADDDLGLRPERQYRPELGKSSKVAEKYRHTVGTGIGPKYRMTPDGRLVRPGTYTTRLRPLLEPGEEDSVEWEKLPSYYHWFPKETEHDYIENFTWREMKGHISKEAGVMRAGALMHGDLPGEKDIFVNPDAEEMPWDSSSIPLATLQELKNPEEIIVHDPKSSRMVGMGPKAFEIWKKMMDARKKGEKPEQEVEYDQEQFVTDKQGKLHDLSKMRFVPLTPQKWNQGSRGLYRKNHNQPN